LPEHALIVRVFNRHLGWESDKSLRYANADDYRSGASKAEVERFAMAQNDFMWIPEAEWKALIPAELRKGASQPAPTSFVLRLFRFHLDPARGFTESANFTRSPSNSGSITLTVQDVTTEKLVIAVEGKAELTQPGQGEPSIYRPALAGVLEFDRHKQRFTRFDLIALGTASGLPRDANGKIAFRDGAYPVGIAFELVVNPTPAERLHPRGARDNPVAYLQPK
jgi:hypothetical protein